MSELSFEFAYTFIFFSCGLGLIFGIWNYFQVKIVSNKNVQVANIEITDKSQSDVEEQLVNKIDIHNLELIIDTARKIQEVTKYF